MGAIFKREFRSYFTSPLGYVVLAILLFFEGFAFSVLYSYSTTDIMAVFGLLPTVMSVVIPVITMRLISEDRKLKVDQALLTAPITVGKLVMGKFFAALSVFSLAMMPTLLFQIIITSKVATNWLLYFNALFGIILLGAALIAIGMFISALTESSVVSAILTLSVFLLLSLITGLAGLTNQAWLVSVAEYLAIFQTYTRFLESVFHLTDVIFLLSITGVFCFLTVRAVEKRRWA